MLEQIGGRQLDSEQVAVVRCRGADPGSLSMSYRYYYGLQKLAGTPHMELMHLLRRSQGHIFFCVSYVRVTTKFLYAGLQLIVTNNHALTCIFSSLELQL
jgi:hypothetical protein